MKVNSIERVKMLKQTTVVINNVPCTAWVDSSKILYAVEYQGEVHATSTDGTKLQFDPNHWADLIES
jgi:hypothetical protein